MLSKEYIIARLKDNKGILLEQFHISQIGLFGSHSIDQQSPASDLDLVYKLKANYKLGIKELYDLETFLSSIFKTEKIDLVNKDYLNPIIALEMSKSVIYV